MLPDPLHSIQFQLGTATSYTLHEKLFNYKRKSGTRSYLSSWLTNLKKVLLRKHVRENKYKPSEVELLEANPEYAYIRNPDGKKDTLPLEIWHL